MTPKDQFDKEVEENKQYLLGNHGKIEKIFVINGKNKICLEGQFFENAIESQAFELAILQRILAFSTLGDKMLVNFVTKK